MRKYQAGSYVRGPLPVYLEQLQEIDLRDTDQQDPNVWAFSSQFTGQPTPQIPERTFMPARIPNLVSQQPSINTSRALVSQGSTSDVGVNANTYSKTRLRNKNTREIAKYMDMFSTTLLGISQQYRNNKNEKAAQEVMNNPYMGLIPSYNGRSEGVRYGYQRGGEVDPFEELYREIEDEALAGTVKEGAKVEPPTESQVEAIQQAQILKEQRKQIGREIVNSYNPRYSDAFSYNEEVDWDDEDAGVATNYSSQGSSPDLLQRFKNGISAVESGGSYGAQSKFSSAFGKYQFIEGTRNAVREKYFPQMNKKEFEAAYRVPQFQEQVMDAYSQELLSKYGDPNKAAIAFFLGEGKANKVNTPSYRPTKNNASVGEYLNKFNRGFYR